MGVATQLILAVGGASQQPLSMEHDVSSTVWVQFLWPAPTDWHHWDLLTANM